MSLPEDNSSTAVERALSILESVSSRASGMTNAEISQRLDIPKSTASYLLRTLEQRGYLRREKASGKYKLGLKVLSLSHTVLTGLDIREVALPFLRQFVERNQLTAHLAILDQGRAVYVEKVEAPGFVKMDTWIGHRVDIHTTSVGKALVSLLPEAEVSQMLEHHGMTRHTAKTITARAKFMRELEKVRSQGYAIDDEENSIGVRCLAAPIFNAERHIIAAVGTSGTTAQIDKAHLRRAIEGVKEMARNISQQLGYQARALPRR